MDHLYRQLGLDVVVMNFHALEMLVLGDYIHIGFGIVSKVALSTLLRVVGKLKKTPVILETWTLNISLFWLVHVIISILLYSLRAGFLFSLLMSSTDA